jgi:hypothetical protein
MANCLKKKVSVYNGYPLYHRRLKFALSSVMILDNLERAYVPSGHAIGPVW